MVPILILITCLVEITYRFSCSLVTSLASITMPDVTANPVRKLLIDADFES